jgi:two-component system, NarL family, nitrate/nitrite response regulator NarL
MGAQVATIIIEPRLLVREALESLMGSHSYRVVCGVGSMANIVHPSIAGDGAKLVILGAQSADISVSEASGIRKLWPDSKIVLLFEHASPADFQKLLASQIDGCVPLFVSPETLVNTLDLIMTRDVRVMVMDDTRRPSPPPADKEVEIKIDNAQSDGTKHRAMPTSAGAANGSTAEARNGDTPHVPPLRNGPRLSEREVQVLIGLVKGRANKVIARTCDITEATVKVHMKSILRKIQVANRTQAAIWALEHGYLGDEDRMPKAAASPEDSASAN